MPFSIGWRRDGANPADKRSPQHHIRATNLPQSQNLHFVLFNTLFCGGYGDGDGIVRVIAQKFGPNKTMTINVEDLRTL